MVKQSTPTTEPAVMEHESTILAGYAEASQTIALILQSESYGSNWLIIDLLFKLE